MSKWTSRFLGRLSDNNNSNECIRTQFARLRTNRFLVQERIKPSTNQDPTNLNYKTYTTLYDEKGELAHRDEYYQVCPVSLLQIDDDRVLMLLENKRLKVFDFNRKEIIDSTPIRSKVIDITELENGCVVVLTTKKKLKLYDREFKILKKCRAQINNDSPGTHDTMEGIFILYFRAMKGGCIDLVYTHFIRNNTFEDDNPDIHGIFTFFSRWDTLQNKFIKVKCIKDTYNAIVSLDEDRILLIKIGRKPWPNTGHVLKLSIWDDRYDSLTPVEKVIDFEHTACNGHYADYEHKYCKIDIRVLDRDTLVLTRPDGNLFFYDLSGTLLYRHRIRSNPDISNNSLSKGNTPRNESFVYDYEEFDANNKINRREFFAMNEIGDIFIVASNSLVHDCCKVVMQNVRNKRELDELKRILPIELYNLCLDYQSFWSAK